VEIHHPNPDINREIERNRMFADTSARTGYYREQIISNLSRYTYFPRENIALFGGKHDMWGTILRLADGKEQEIAAVEPLSGSIESITTHFGLRLNRHYTTSPFASDIDGLLERITPDTDFVYLANPNPITGVMYSEYEAEKILAQNRNIQLIIDESLFEYSQYSLARLVNYYDNIIIVRSLSDFFELEGVDADYIITSGQNIECMRPNNHGQIPTLALAALAVSFGHLEYELKRRENIRENIIYLTASLRARGINCRTTPADSILVKVANTEEVLRMLDSYDIKVTDPGDIPGLQGYLAVMTDGDRESKRIIDCFDKMPDEWILSGLNANRKITLRRTRANVGPGTNQ
jgi:histidinol-phosphate/aromatic aminotransferase/cobyric acid decarboxylase-like protein